MLEKSTIDLEALIARAFAAGHAAALAGKPDVPEAGTVLDVSAPSLSLSFISSLLLQAFQDPYWADAMLPGFRGCDFQKLYDAMTEDHAQSMEIGGSHDWPSLLIAAFGVMAGEA